jgi:hypothetical protein
MARTLETPPYILYKAEAHPSQDEDRNNQFNFLKDNYSAHKKGF